MHRHALVSGDLTRVLLLSGGRSGRTTRTLRSHTALRQTEDHLLKTDRKNVIQGLNLSEDIQLI